MRQLIGFISVGSLLVLFGACGSGDNGVEEKTGETTMTHNEANGHSHDEEGRGSDQMEMEEGKELPSMESWVREQPIDVNAIDVNGDGYVYQDEMDLNVIADEEGKCPTCGMFLKKVTVGDAAKNLRDNGFEIAGVSLH